MMSEVSDNEKRQKPHQPGQNPTSFNNLILSRRLLSDINRNQFYINYNQDRIINLSHQNNKKRVRQFYLYLVVMCLPHP